VSEPAKKIEISVDLSPDDRATLDRVPALEREIELMKAALAARACTATTATESVFMSPKKFAARWDVSERTVRGWIADESFPVETAGLRLVRIPVTAGDQWVREHGKERA